MHGSPLFVHERRKALLNDVHYVRRAYIILFRHTIHSLVFYTKEDLLKFYHHLKFEKDIIMIKNYLNSPKKNGYKAFHLKYKNIYMDCPINFLECQLYIIDDYYNSLYGTAQYEKKH